MKRRAVSEWGAIAAGGFLVLATATSVLGARGSALAVQQCSGGSPCGGVKVKCKPAEDACCCKVGAGLYGCGCHTADYCQRPPEGTTCFD